MRMAYLNSDHGLSWVFDVEFWNSAEPIVDFVSEARCFSFSAGGGMTALA